MKIGNFETENNVFLAPMAGVTDLPFRKICRRYGAGLVYSEMVSAKGLYYNDKKTADLMRIDDEERPCAIQIFGSDADIMAEVIPKVMAVKPDIIDINMGCPTPKIVNNGDGSALLKTPEKIGEIVHKVSSASPVPVTVKIRKGWDDDSINAVEVANIIEQGGAAAIAIHGRTRAEFYSGTADWDIVKSRKAVCLGFATLMASLCRSIDIPCNVVSGYALGVGNDTAWTDTSIATDEQNHAWNEVYVDGRWMIVDTTWDCANKIENGEMNKGEVSHLYFDANLQFFSNNHKILEYSKRR